MSDGQTWVVIGGFVAMLVAMFTVIPWLLRAQQTRFDARFDAMDAKFDAKIDGLDAKFEAKFDAVDAKFEAMDAKFEAKLDAMDAKLDARFDAADARSDGIEAKLDALTGLVHEHGDRLTRVEHEITQLRGDVNHLSSTMAPIVDELLRAGVAGRPRAAG